MTIDPAVHFTFDRIVGDSPSETGRLRRAHSEARGWLSSHRKWCASIEEGYFVLGVAGTFTLHLFRLVPSKPEVPPWQWVMYGDIPPAYLPVDDAATPHDAIRSYVEECEEWARRVESGDSVDDLMPISAAPTPEHAKMLKGRMQFIRQHWLNEGETPGSPSRPAESRE